MLDKIGQCSALDEKTTAVLGDIPETHEGLGINEEKVY